MDLSKIKNLIKQNGDKFILVENDQPEIVMLSFKEYEKLRQNPKSYDKDFSEVETDKVKETEFIIPLGAATDPVPAKPLRLEDIRLEDLPL